ncbi:MAG: hypothetical protein FJ278_25000, partial [Planctomycetes bacterium]|nr:hypothetical protein [Planctomycetota bacterium]
VDNIRIAAPTNAAKGTVFLDRIEYNTLTDYRMQVIPEQAAQWRHPVLDERRFPKPEAVSEAERAGIRALLGPDAGAGTSETRVRELCEQVKALGIVRDEHGVRGPTFESPAAMANLALQVAHTYRASREPAQRRQLAEAFLTVEDHLFDQGMQAGSGFVWGGYAGRTWADAVYLMRDALAQAGRLVRQLDYFLYNYSAGRIFAEADPPSNMDFYGIDVRYQLYSCLMQPDAAERVRWLRAFKAMLERSILQPTSALKVDGSTFHHGGHYFAYACYQMPGLCAIVQKLSETPFRLNAEAHERVRRAVLAQRIFCNQRDVPLSLSGRHPFGGSTVNPWALDLLARSGTPDGRQPLDP